MPSLDLNRKLMALGLFFMPVVLVQATGAYLGRVGPDQANAATTDEAAPSAQTDLVKAPQWTPRQLAAGKHVAELRTTAVPATPFLHDLRDPGQTSSSTIKSTPVTAQTPAPVTMPKFVVQAILSSTIGKTALIDGKPYREGDEVRQTGWFIEHIVVETRSVTLKDSRQDRTMTIAVEMPTLEGQQ